MSVDIDEVPLWYHTIDLPDGRSTPGWFDLRPIMDQIPWPDLHGKRCLDIATWDGSLAFEMERRGASEVVATDIEDHRLWDWLPRERETGPGLHDAMVGSKGRGFEVAKDLLGSAVERQWLNVYDLSPERLGEFDVVTCGALLLHLRDPFKALEAIASVTRSTFVSIEQVDPLSSTLLPRHPVSHVEGQKGRWSIANVAAHRRMLEIVGFSVEATTTFAEPFGEGHPASGSVPRDLRSVLGRVRFGGQGVPKSAIRARVELRPEPLMRETS